MTEQEIKKLDKRLTDSIAERKQGYMSLEKKIDQVSEDVCGVKEDVADLRGVVNKNVLTTLKKHQEELTTQTSRLSSISAQLEPLVALYPTLQESVELKKSADIISGRLSRWAKRWLPIITIITALILTTIAVSNKWFK